jgi:hypothetical protein
MRSARPNTLPTIDICSLCVSDSGPVRTYSAPACPSSHSARTPDRGWIWKRPQNGRKRF